MGESKGKCRVVKKCGGDVGEVWGEVWECGKRCMGFRGR